MPALHVVRGEDDEDADDDDEEAEGVNDGVDGDVTMPDAR